MRNQLHIIGRQEMKRLWPTTIRRNIFLLFKTETADKVKLILSSVFLLIFLLSSGSLKQEENLPEGSFNNSIVESKVTISGTSSVRDWRVVTNSISASRWNGPVEQLFIADPEDLSLQNGIFAGIELRLPVEQLDSGIRIMNQTMMEHLKSDSHPEIGYTIRRVRSVFICDENEGCYQMAITGIADAAGVHHEMDHEVTLCLNHPKGNGKAEKASIRVFGEFELLMTSFEIDPPTFMGGSLKTGDLIKVAFEIVF